MKTYNSIIQLVYVPEHISQETDGDIAEDMFLCGDAVAALIQGYMFSPLDCMYHYAGVFDESDSAKAKHELLKRGFLCKVITLFPHC